MFFSDKFFVDSVMLIILSTSFSDKVSNFYIAYYTKMWYNSNTIIIYYCIETRE